MRIFQEQKKQQGEIDSYDFFVFDDFFAEFGGVTIWRGDPDKLERVSQSDEAISLGHRSQLIFKNFRMIKAFFGKSLQDRLANYIKQVQLLR